MLKKISQFSKSQLYFFISGFIYLALTLTVSIYFLATISDNISKDAIINATYFVDSGLAVFCIGFLILTCAYYLHFVLKFCFIENYKNTQKDNLFVYFYTLIILSTIAFLIFLNVSSLSNIKTIILKYNYYYAYSITSVILVFLLIGLHIARWFYCNLFFIYSNEFDSNYENYEPLQDDQDNSQIQQQEPSPKSKTTVQKEQENQNITQYNDELQSNDTLPTQQPTQPLKSQPQLEQEQPKKDKLSQKSLPIDNKEVDIKENKKDTNKPIPNTTTYTTTYKPDISNKRNTKQSDIKPTSKLTTNATPKLASKTPSKLDTKTITKLDTKATTKTPLKSAKLDNTIKPNTKTTDKKPTKK